ncbi:MAG: hypothetical protein HXS41_08080 [Theionarchaea archaeon]|nr:hypothetical protein [Theionarchaea archaeon]MBU7001647.1 hypothetical protein [Theionarchaea archaeon]MBU7021005.1 hypothetical protein [Theionarchaea archaeon]MBU7034356.1 hypothetical protein [Theionarchaea archaeon]MBU7041585.1 hypothetical protein [Theionarchaea archaeon]
MSKVLKYFIIGAIFWLLVDWTTAFQPDLQRWLTYWPEIWMFYLGFPFIFAFLIYKRMWNNRRIFVATLAEIFIVEIVFTHNVLLYTFPIMILALPVGIILYSLLVFVPKWIVDGELKENKWKLTLMVLVWIFVSIATYVGNSGMGA